MTKLKSMQRIISVLLVFLLFLSVLPFGAFASELTEQTESTEETMQPTETEATVDTTPTEEFSETTEPMQETIVEETTVTKESTEPETEPTEPEPAPTEDTTVTEPTEAEPEEIPVTPLNLFDNGISFFAQYTLTKWLDHMLMPHTTIYVDWTFPDGSEPYLNGSTGYGDATFQYPSYLEVNGAPAYCIFPGVDSSRVTYTDEQALDTWENGFSEAQRQAIGLIVALGYGAQDFEAAEGDNMASKYGWNAAKTLQVQKHMATQILLWEIIVQDRSATYPYTLNNSRIWDSFYKASDSWHNWPTMLKVRNEILAKMQASTAVPSFASNASDTAPSVELKYNSSTKQYTATLTDTNAVLANYNFSTSTSGITFTKSGNNLTITATAAAVEAMKKTPVTASVAGPSVAVDPAREAIVWSANGYQPVVTAAEYSPVTAYIKLTADASGTATMQKTTTASNGDVEGYCFKIYQWGGSSWYGKTDANGNVYLTDSNYNAGTKTYTFEGLTDGEYTFLEVLSKKGAGNVFPNSWTITVTNTNGAVVYNKTFTTEIVRDSNGDARLGPNDAKISITGLSGGGKMTMTINNAPETGDLKIIKTSSSGNVSGFNFKVEGNSISKTVQSGSDGSIRVDGLAEGTYKVTEILPEDSPYYCTTDNPQTVKVEAGKLATVTFNNEPKKWRVIVTKEDAETGAAQADATLDGAVYGLYKDGTLVKRYTVKNGTFTTDSYACGTGYTLKEISAPPGYQLDTDVYNLDAYSAAGKCTGPLTTSQVTVLEDVIKGYFQITKRTKNPVSGATAAEVGAVFRYWLKSAGSYDACAAACKGTLTTGTGGVGKSKALPYGTYVVEQTEMLVGTDKIDPFEVTISQYGKTYEYTKDDPFWTGTVSIVKYEAGTTTPLKAKFNLLDSSRTVLESGTTGSDGKLSFTTKLVFGLTYYIQETEAPEGYVLDDSLYPISVTNRDQAITLTLYNKPEEGSISIKKVDMQGNPMAGVKFCLEYSTDGSTWNTVISRNSGSGVTLGGCTSSGLSNGILTTDKNGAAVFSGLRISDQNGKVYYRLTEVSTGNGSTMLLEPAFEGELPFKGSKDITVTAVNSSGFELPHTGSNELLILTLAQILCMTMCAGMLLTSRKKK